MSRATIYAEENKKHPSEVTFYGFLNMNKTEEMKIFGKVNGERLLVCHLFQNLMSLLCSDAGSNQDFKRKFRELS